MTKNINGFSCESSTRLILNSGAWFKNFIIGSDTVKTALAAGKCLGLTKGGGSFVATPEVAAIEADGISGNGKGLTQFNGWTVTMTVNLLEISEEAFRDALGSGEIDSTSNDKYHIIRARNQIKDSDYIDNLTWVGTLSGSDEPVMIQIYNALSLGGFTLSPTDKSQAVLPITYTATQNPCDGSGTDALNYAPFAIYYPKSIAIPTIDPISSTETEISGKGLTGATVKVYGGTIPTNTTAIVDTSGNWTAEIPAQTAGTTLYASQTINGKTSLPASIIVS